MAKLTGQQRHQSASAQRPIILRSFWCVDASTNSLIRCKR
jgi:hypothetical protein